MILLFNIALLFCSSFHIHLPCFISLKLVYCVRIKHLFFFFFFFVWLRGYTQRQISRQVSEHACSVCIKRRRCMRRERERRVEANEEEEEKRRSNNNISIHALIGWSSGRYDILFLLVYRNAFCLRTLNERIFWKFKCFNQRFRIWNLLLEFHISIGDKNSKRRFCFFSLGMW